MECSLGLAPDVVSIYLCTPILFWIVGHSRFDDDTILKAVFFEESESGELSVICTDTSNALPCSLKAFLKHEEEFKGLFLSLECFRHSKFGFVTVSVGKVSLSVGTSDR